MEWATKILNKLKDTFNINVLGKTAQLMIFLREFIQMN